MGPSAAPLVRRTFAWLATAAMLFVAAGPVAAGHAAIDRACVPSLLQAHDHAAHRIGTEPEHGPDHCAACHLTRTAGVSAAPRHTLTSAIQPQSAPRLVHEPVAGTERHTDFTRGPPTS
jgi:hypothetical protein